MEISVLTYGEYEDRRIEGIFGSAHAAEQHVLEDARTGNGPKVISIDTYEVGGVDVIARASVIALIREMQHELPEMSEQAKDRDYNAGAFATLQALALKVQAMS
jgi:hypothetical protein